MSVVFITFLLIITFVYRQPSNQPSSQPTRQPSTQPSRQPSQQPTMQPSRQPSVQPTTQPFANPSSQPSNQPTNHVRCAISHFLSVLSVVNLTILSDWCTDLIKLIQTNHPFLSLFLSFSHSQRVNQPHNRPHGQLSHSK